MRGPLGSPWSQALSADLVTVFQTSDPVILMMVKAALDADSIPFVVQGEGIQDWVGMGRFPAGYNAVTGPVRIHVAAENADAAREALEGIEE
jgi:hypothetical protein